MVKITEALIRRKSEHNELIIGTLEELSLHQEDIECIEHVQNWCRDLRILLLQSNLIARIENVHKLRQLEYLNLAVNNIERIENLEQCESLQKLDLTLNFIGMLTDVERMEDNYNLRELILTGNPCTDYAGYRDYVVATLPQLVKLDCADISETDRLKARQGLAQKRARIVQLQAEQRMQRDAQKVRIAEEREREAVENAGLDEDAVNDRFWKKNSEHCPETRVEIVRQQRKVKKLDEVAAKPVKSEVKLFAPCGRAYCINQPKLEFDFLDEPDRYELNLKVHKFMDTSLLEVDAQPNYVRATVKGKVFQMALGAEIRCAESSTKRSMITGHLLIVMPKLSWTDGAQIASENIAAREAKKRLKQFTANSEPVNYKNIVGKVDDADVPPLV